MSWPGNDHHAPCPCGAELADECQSCARTNLFGSMRLEPGIGSSPVTVKCWRGECRQGCFYPSACDQTGGAR